MPKTWLITGTSSGFGRETTELLLERGDRVAATLRNSARLDDPAGRYGDQLWRAELDVTDTDRMRDVVDRAFADLGRIDVVVSNAGYGVIGLAEELSDEQIRRQIDTNVVASIQLKPSPLKPVRLTPPSIAMARSLSWHRTGPWNNSNAFMRRKSSRSPPGLAKGSRGAGYRSGSFASTARCTYALGTGVQRDGSGMP